jgi:glycerate dehydrogenase
MKIVVLDGHTLNPGDLSWDALAALGDLEVYDRSEADEVLERARDAEIVLVNKVRLGKGEINALPLLKYIGVLATGYDVVDVQAASRKGIPVTNIPAYGTKSVSQMVFALLLELCHQAAAHSNAVKRGEWSEREDFCFWNTPQIELDGKTIGIVGYGRIGNSTAEIAKAFGMNVIIHDLTAHDGGSSRGIEWVDFTTLLTKADVISLHCPLTPETRGIINKDSLGKMKRSSCLINTSRGPLVIEEDLASALNNGTIAGAGLDVLTIEPPLKDNPLFSAKNCIITPHIAWATVEARSRLMNMAVQNIKAYLGGRLVNTV